MAVTILSINAKGLNSPFKRAMLWKEASNVKAAIVCAQETHFRASSPMRLCNSKFPHVFVANAEKKKSS